MKTIIQDDAWTSYNKACKDAKAIYDKACEDALVRYLRSTQS